MSSLGDKIKRNLDQIYPQVRKSKLLKNNLTFPNGYQLNHKRESERKMHSIMSCIGAIHFILKKVICPEFAHHLQNSSRALLGLINVSLV